MLESIAKVIEINQNISNAFILLPIKVLNIFTKMWITDTHGTTTETSE